MRSKLIAIGNSKGVRIPKSLIEQYQFKDNVEFDFQPEGLLIRKCVPARKDWADAFQRMAASQDDGLLDLAPLKTKWDQEEWEW